MGLSFGMIPASRFTKPVALTFDAYNKPLPVPVNDYLNPLYTQLSPNFPSYAFQPEAMATTNITTLAQMEVAILAARVSRCSSMCVRLSLFIELSLACVLSSQRSKVPSARTSSRPAPPPPPRSLSSLT
jgi:hypothetical protein